MAARLTDMASGLKVIAMPVRSTPTANRNDWGAFAYAGGRTHEAVPMHSLEVLDRVGSGDAFASGLIFGLLTGREMDWALHCGLAHGALVLTTPGDNSFATFAEVAELMAGAGAHVRR
jgi:2-dehydro-3-deoxygluconokinase